MATKRLDIFNNKLSIHRLELVDILEDFIHCIESLPKEYTEHLIFKGGMALLSAMAKYGKLEFERMTKDLDIHCDSEENWELFKSQLNGISKYSELELMYKCSVQRPLVKNNISETLEVEVNDKNKNTYKFTIDMNINKAQVETELYKGRFITLDFEGYSVETMLTDKLSVFATKILCRRVKDLHDIYTISNFKNLHMGQLVEIYKNKHKEINPNDIYGVQISNVKDIEHAYNKLLGIKNKYPFNILYTNVVEFTVPIYHSICTNTNLDLIWKCEERCWK